MTEREKKNAREEEKREEKERERKREREKERTKERREWGQLLVCFICFMFHLSYHVCSCIYTVGK